MSSLFKPKVTTGDEIIDRHARGESEGEIASALGLGIPYVNRVVANHLAREHRREQRRAGKFSFDSQE